MTPERVAEVLIEEEAGLHRDAQLKALSEHMAARAPVEDITDADIDREVQAVRDTSRSA